jgi:hypothetical protein
MLPETELLLGHASIVCFCVGAILLVTRALEIIVSVSIEKKNMVLEVCQKALWEVACLGTGGGG